MFGQLDETLISLHSSPHGPTDKVIFVGKPTVNGPLPGHANPTRHKQNEVIQEGKELKRKQWSRRCTIETS